MKLKKTLLHRLTAMTAGVCMLTAMMIVSGCTKVDNPDPTSDSVSGGGDTATSVKSALLHPDESMNLGGKTLQISVWGQPAAEGAGDAYVDRRYERERRTEKRYNVNIEWVATNIDKFVQDVTLAFTSRQKYADLIFAPSSHAFKLCQLGAVLPLDDYIDYSSPFYAVTRNNLLYVDGKHYSYMPDEYSPNDVGYFITYNQDLLSDAGCEDPQELYKAGKWDWDAFAKIIQQTTKVGSDGTVTQWGVGGSNLLDALCISDGFTMIGMDTTAKKFSCNLYTDAGLNVLNFLKKIAYDYKGCDGNYGGHNSKITFGDTKTAMLICPSYYPGDYIQKGMPVASVPLPKGPDTTRYANGQDLQEWWMVSAISDFTTEQLVQVALDMNDNDPAYEDTYFSEEGLKQNFITRSYDGCVFATEEEAEFYYDFIRSDDVDKMLNITTDSIKSTMAEKVFSAVVQGEEPRTVLERVKPVVEQALKDMLPDALK